MKIEQLFSGITLIAAFALPTAAPAQQTHRTHARGQIAIDVVIEGPTVVIAMESPLENFIGISRAPKTDEEKKAAEEAVAQLRAADLLFKIDPVANCKLGPVTLRSPALGLGKPETDSAEADLYGSFAFNCTNPAAAKFIDIALFNAFKGPRQIDAQVNAPQGQFKRTLKRPNTRLAWGN